MGIFRKPSIVPYGRRAAPIPSAVAASGDISASITASGSLTGTLLGAGALAASLAGVGALTATLTGAGALASSMAGSGTLTGTLTATGAVASNMAGTGALSGTLTGAGALASSMTGTGALSGTLSGDSAIFPLSVHASGRYLVTALGDPFHMLGESAWDIGGMLPLTGSISVTTWLNSRQALGVNLVMMRLMSKRLDQTGDDGNATRGIALRDNTLPFNTAGDLSDPNDTYFDHYDAIIDLAAARGIAVLIAVCYSGFGSNQDDGWGSQLAASSAATARGFGEYLATRWANKDNVLLLAGGDHTAAGTLQTRIGDLVGTGATPSTGYRSIDASKLWTYHPDNGSRAEAGGVSNTTDLEACYSWVRATMDSLFAAAYADTPTRPVFQIEALYENNTTDGGTRFIVRRDYILATLLGGIGGVVGDERVWPGGEDNPPVVTGYDTDAEWLTALNNTSDGGDVGIRDCSEIHAAFASRAWQFLFPENGDLITAETDAVGAFDGGALGVVWTEGGASFTVDLSVFSDVVTATWIDPTSGATTAATGSPFAASGTHAFVASTEVGTNDASDDDWLLFLEAADGAIESSMAGTGTLTATLSGAGALASSMAGTGALTATLTGAGALACSAAASGALTGTLLGAGALNASLTGTGTLTATFSNEANIASSMTATGTLAATLTGTGALACSMAGTSACSGTLTASGSMTASAAATGTLSGTLTGSGALACVMTATSLFYVSSTAPFSGSGSGGGSERGRSRAGRRG